MIKLVSRRKKGPITFSEKSVVDLIFPCSVLKYFALLDYNSDLVIETFQTSSCNRSPNMSALLISGTSYQQYHQIGQPQVTN